jgi:hypothetical protein
MSTKFLDQVFYRAAGAALAAIPTITGTYPTAAVTGWTAIVGAAIDKNKLGLDADGKTPQGDGTDRISSEKASVEITVNNFTTANYTTLRSAFLNTKVDICAFDNEDRTVVYVVQGILLYPKPEIQAGEEPKLVISGERRAGAGIANTPFKIWT